MTDKCGCVRDVSDSSIREDVKEYYSALKSTSDLKTNACVAPSTPLPAFIRQALGKVHPEVTSRYYGCGLVVPESLEGCRVLDLGSGSGRDCYMLSQLVGEKGHVTGLDMTEEQLQVARKYLDHHMKEFGYKASNVSFVQGYIEALAEAGLEKDSFDIIISNCVVNLSPDKKKVLSEAYRILKNGGELYFSDVYSSGRLTTEIKNHKVLWGECFGVDNKELQDILGEFKFVSATYRLFKLPEGSSKPCRVIYNGGITGVENCFPFDCQYTFKAEEVVEVDRDLANILSFSRFKEDFTFEPPTQEQCGAKAKGCLVDPFELVLQLEKQSPDSTTRRCCSTQSASCCK
ncbi:hypothetical protein WMY93_006673 [Mugilogobius chulae]|uniref:Arsenite methyltransferase n=1 Tax=Mugilogobius chulae TaxID=88201 RepID=A0AAW0PKG7_9GOBI